MRRRPAKRLRTHFDITVADHQKKLRLSAPRIRRIIADTLRYQKVSRAVLSVVFVTGRKIRGMNKKFLKRDYATDVLAFDPGEQKAGALNGDIVISTDAALKNAKEYKTDVSQELVLYIIHGILHLLGYDDHSPTDIQKMRKKEKIILDRLGSRKISGLFTPRSGIL